MALPPCAHYLRLPGPVCLLSPQKPPLATKLLAELPDEARVVAGRFPFPSWTPSSTLGQGLEQVWAYDMKEVRQAARHSRDGSPSDSSLLEPGTVAWSFSRAQQ